MTLVTNLPPVSITPVVPVANLPPVCQLHRWQIFHTPVVNFATAIAGVIDIGGKIATGVNDTSGKFATNVEIMGTISDYLPLNVLKEKIYLCVNSTTNRCPNKITINVPLFKKLRDIIFFCGTITL